MQLDLYVITDENLSRGRSHAEIARDAVDGGACAIQLRDKTRSPHELVRIGREIRAITRRAGALFIVNDRIDVALACGADGVHVGQEDLRCDTAVQLAPPGFIVGVSAGSVPEALRAERNGAGYIALSPTFSTGSKPDAGPGHGLDLLRTMRSSVQIPVIGIGGIGPGNAGAVIDAGADGIAVISAVVAQPDIAAACRELLAVVAERKRARTGNRRTP